MIRWFVVAAVCASCACGGSSNMGVPETGSGSGSAAGSGSGLELVLSNGNGRAPAAPEPPVVATAQVIGDATALFARARPLAVDEVEPQPAPSRPGPVAPPTTGEKLRESFPPPPSLIDKPVVATGPVHVVRSTPQGDVDDAHEVSVTFDQPMDVTKSIVTITPQPKGAWHWIGTRTVVFIPDGDRFPGATDYTVHVALDQPVDFQFSTTAPKLVDLRPSGVGVPIDTPLILVFDQQVDPQAVMAALPFGTTIAAPDDKRLADVVATMPAGKWVALQPVVPFPRDTEVKIVVAPGLASKEGPRRTTEPQGKSFTTVKRFELRGTTCAPECDPEQVTLLMTTALSTDEFRDSFVKVSPPVPDLRIEVSGYDLQLSGAFAPSTTYTITLDKQLADAAHQTLGTDVTVTAAIAKPRPRFYGPTGIKLVSPATPRFEFYSSQYPALKVELYPVTPADMVAYLKGAWQEPDVAHRAITPVTMELKTEGKVLDTTTIPLDKALVAGRGHVVAIVEPAVWTDPKERRPRWTVWVQVSPIAIDAHVDQDHVVVFASDLATGAPIAGAEVRLSPEREVSAITDVHGIASLPRPVSKPRAEPAMITATHGTDTTMIEGEAWRASKLEPTLAWHVFDDRALYRPGETVNVKGWVRIIDPDRGGDVHGVAGKLTSIAYEVRDGDELDLAKGTIPVDALGGFDFKVKLPPSMFGDGRIYLVASGNVPGRTELFFQVQEFRRPDFETIAHASADPIIAGDGGDLTVDAHYFAGGPLTNAKVTWGLSGTSTTYRPPHRDDYAFGVWKPWWMMWEAAFPDDVSLAPFTSKTDLAGHHVLHVAARTVSQPYAMTARATVEDASNQSWTSDTKFVVHPASLYVGVHTDKPFARANEPMLLKLIGVDIDGNAVAGAKISVDVTRHVTAWDSGKQIETDVEPQHCALVSAAVAVTCKLEARTGGTYVASVTITDPRGRTNRTELRYYVEGEAPVERTRVSRQTVDLVPDKREYAAGDTAEVLVRAPFAPAKGIVTLRRSGIVDVRPIELATASTVITVPITDALVPNLEVQVDVVGVVANLPAYAVGTTSLAIPPKQRALAVTIEPSVAKAAPGEVVTLAVDVKDAKGAAASNAEVTIYAVDDSVLALARYEVFDPLESFYEARPSNTRSYYARDYVVIPHGLEPPEPPRLRYGVKKPGYGIGSGRGATPVVSNVLMDDESPGPPPDPSVVGPAAPEATKIAMRSNFDPLAVFAAAVPTDANGHATVPVTLPDNLTRYRLIAIAAAGETKFGKGEAVLTARLPLMVRATPPRFLSFGDKFQLPITVQNQTDAPMTVQLAARGSNLTIDPQARQVTVPANDRVLVEIPAAAAGAGTARVQIVASSGTAGDAQELAIPVWMPVSSETFATYGTVDRAPIIQPFALPGNVLPGIGGVEISFASTNLQALTDALIYLVRYPYECSEQRSSRMLAIAGLRDVLAAFHAKDLPAPAQLAASMKTDIDWITKLQGGDGGFSYWKQAEPSDPYVSVFVTHALVVAKRKGYPVNDAVLDSAKQYLAEIQTHVPDDWSDEEKLSIEAFALATRAELGDPDLARATELAATKDLPVDAAAWLLGMLANKPPAIALERYLQTRVREQAGTASIAASYRYGWRFLASEGRTSALVLDAMMKARPNSDLIPKLVAGLLADKRRGHWLSTQEDAFVLTALDHYFHTYEKVAPSFVARAWLGDDYAGEHGFRGRTTETATIAVGLDDAKSHHDVTIAKEGAGRLYYRIGASYATSEMTIQPADHGFTVTRRYEPVDHPDDVVNKDGVWHVKAGSRVRVMLEMAVDGFRYRVALVDPLPAGFEPVNPELAGSQDDPNKSWLGWWFDHQNLRDERVESFATQISSGAYAIDYIARATVRGTFIAAPAKAEEMYMPETFGRSGTDRVIIE